MSKDYGEQQITYTKKAERKTLTLTIFYHSTDSWQPVLGLAVFAFWLKLRTFANRKDHKVVGKNVLDFDTYKSIAKKMNIGEKTVYTYCQKLYEYGLLDTIDMSEPGKARVIINVYDTPIYSDSPFCDLVKCRDWKNRNTYGQQISAISRIKKAQQEQLVEGIGTEAQDLDLKIESLWDEVKKYLARNMPINSFNTWISSLKFVGIENDTLVLNAPNQFAKDWIENKYENEILKAFQELGFNVKSMMMNLELF
jgi:hypothetical protein